MTKEDLRLHCVRTLKQSLPEKLRQEHQLILDILEENKALRCCGNCKYKSETEFYMHDTDCQGDNCKDNNLFCWVKGGRL